MRMRVRSVVFTLNMLAAAAAFGTTEGDLAPDFTLPVLGDESAMSLSDSHGKVRYVDFWASWCAPCRVSIPRIMALQEELGGERFEVIAVNLDERVDDALDFVDRYAMNYVNLSDPHGAVAETYDLKAMPMSYVIDPEGRVTLTHAGFRRGDLEAIRAHILEQLDRLAAGDP